MGALSEAFLGPGPGRRLTGAPGEGGAPLEGPRNAYLEDLPLRTELGLRLPPRAFAWAEQVLAETGAAVSGPVEAWAVETDRAPARLVPYDRTGQPLGAVVMPESFGRSSELLRSLSPFRPERAKAAQEVGADLELVGAAWCYLVDQAEIAMTCALGTGAELVRRLASAHAPADVAQVVEACFPDGEMSGTSAQMLTEPTGGSDLGAIRTRAVEAEDGTWRLDGSKWFVSNPGADVFVVLARPDGAPDGPRGVAPFLVLARRRDGRRNGVVVRRLKDKLGTRGVPSAEVELVDAEAYLLTPGAAALDAPLADRLQGGLRALMALTNRARLQIALMGLGIARRSLVEALGYVRTRSAFGRPLVDAPLVRRRLVPVIVGVETTLTLVLEGFADPGLRLVPALAKLRASRLGVEASIAALELHGGNGYVEDWPIARLVRDALVNPIWEGTDNVLLLDVRRAIQRERADVQVLRRVRAACERATGPRLGPLAARLVTHTDALGEGLAAWARLGSGMDEARLVEVARVLGDLLTAALALEVASQAESAGLPGASRKAVVAELASAALEPRSARSDLAAPCQEVEDAVFGPLVDGVLGTPGHER